MSSIQRKLRRAAVRRNGVVLEKKPQPTVLLPDGGYKTLHPTRGWVRVSGKRVKMRTN